MSAVDLRGLELSLMVPHPDSAKERVTEELVDACRQAAQVGARVIQSAKPDFAVRQKAVADFVTEVDFASQEAIIQLVTERFPRHMIRAEEGHHGASSDHEYCWYIDPLDGTTNFIHGLPYYAVSVSVAWRGQPIVGCILDPSCGDEFWAATGKGAFLGDQPIHVSEIDDLQSALVAVSLPPRARIDGPQVAAMLATIERCRAIRRMGSAALNLAYLAAGRLDAYWATSLNSWDVAAGSLIAQEAGATVTDLDGSAFNLHTPAICVAANEKMQLVLRQLVTAQRSTAE